MLITSKVVVCLGLAGGLLGAVAATAGATEGGGGGGNGDCTSGWQWCLSNLDPPQSCGDAASQCASFCGRTGWTWTQDQCGSTSGFGGCDAMLQCQGTQGGGGGSQ